MKETENKSVEAQVENEGAPVTKKEELLSLGEQRYEKTSQFISNTGKKFSGWCKSGALGLGRLLKGGAFRALAAPEAIVSGVKATGEKIGEEAGYIKDSVKAGANFVGENFVEGTKMLGEDFSQLGNWAERGIVSGATSVYEFSKENYNDGKNFVNEKKAQAGKCVEKISISAEALASLVKERSLQGLDKAKNGCASAFKETVKFGESAVYGALVRGQRAKEGFFSRMNSVKKSVLEHMAMVKAEDMKNKKEKLEAKAIALEARLNKTLIKLGQLQQVERMGTNLEAQAA